MAPKYIKRVTLFKIPNEEDIDAVLAQYDILRKTAQKDGASYIVANEARRIENAAEERSQGYTLISITTFNSKEDYNYYDKQCSAHAKLRDFAATRRTGVAVLQLESDLGVGP
ncbi:uncharacterized protein A1O9_09946 [Exophiala aquamarina CBS 119918]|uniref:Stress-response A/B barrel domain-containing protein n=1 Tax=Exophiala aquamarina CBS 119918 TaxID=1182545 RepID=A0A072P2T3_9EURO|nr:uncharacterized protein A1O9_09946 [Exophiala aquamarina CBS 119918]KEF54151.1 hypothetical protein A1O9_09946 [Exophiala aquamarina CBS 119918]